MKIKNALLVCLMSLCGCSAVMELSRPDPVDLTTFTPGMNRNDVHGYLAGYIGHGESSGQVGLAEGTGKEGNLSYDAYKLYTHGPSGVGKGAIAVTEGTADVFLLFLPELVLTPAEAVTKNKLHLVKFYYDGDDKLVKVIESP